MADKRYNVDSIKGTITIPTSDTVTTGTATLGNVEGVTQTVFFTTPDMEDTAADGMVKMEKEQERRILDMQHWQDLLEALQRESDQVDGWGEVTIRLVYHEGLPREMEVVSRVTR